MRIAVWDIPPADALVAGLTAGGLPADAIVRGTPAVCERLLRAGTVDIALLPTVIVLTDTELFDALPAVALSSWDYPFARLALRHGLERPIRSVAIDPEEPQAALVARIILREHYATEPDFIPYENRSPEEMLATEEDAVLLVGSDVPTMNIDGITMDLGQEWYELANYPMTWGLFATRKGEGDPAWVDTLRQAAARAETRRGVWVRAHDTTPALHAFYTEDLRVRLDDLAVAGLTELRQYIYYLGITDDIPDLPLYVVPDTSADDGDEEDRPML